MKFRRFTAHLAAAGVATALTASALVGATAVAAHAETGSAAYGCAFGGKSLPITVSASADLPVSSWQTHTAAPGGIPISASVVVPRAVLDQLKGLGNKQLGVATGDFALPLGSAAIPLDGMSAPLTDIPAEGDMTFDFDAITESFEMPDAGSYMIQMPQTFTTDISTDKAGTIKGIVCTVDPAATVDIVAFDVTKQSATISGPKSVTGKKGKTVKVPAKVTGAATAATGKLVASEKGKNLATGTLKAGKTVISLKGLKPGKHNITLSYAGDKNTIAATPVVVPVTVKK